MWGQARSRPRHPRRLGIIPTRVGTRGDMLSISPRWNNHPHACGDKRANREKCKYKLGSSPRVWGQDRITIYFHNLKGSSPRVWGQAENNYTFALTVRIIPTRVGTSVICKLDNGNVINHPHACGDKRLMVIL